MSYGFVTVTCDYCGKPTQKRSCDVYKAKVAGRKLYCSKPVACWILAKKKRVVLYTHCKGCKKPLEPWQMAAGNSYCSNSCAHKYISHAHFHSTSELEKRRKTLLALVAQNPHYGQSGRRGQKPYTTSTGRVIQTDSSWEGWLYDYLLRSCPHNDWLYNNEEPFFVHLGEFNWRPDFVISNFHGRKLLVEVKGHPKAVEVFNAAHYPCIQKTKRCWTDFYIALLTERSWSQVSDEDDFDTFLKKLYWVVPFRTYLPRYLGERLR